MKHKLLAMVAAIALLSLPGCCCAPMVCMPVCCNNPYWMEDLRDDYCYVAGSVHASLHNTGRCIRCNLSHWNAQLECSGRQHAQMRIAKQPRVEIAPKTTAKCPPPESDACEAPGSKCQERCSHCKQQPCRCGKCSGFEPADGASRPSIFSRSQPFNVQDGDVPGASAPSNPPPATISPNQEPAQVPPAPAVPAPPPSRPGSPTPIPVPIPKITPNTTTQTPAIVPPVDPSIPLEQQTNSNQVGFRKAEMEKPLYNGWKPVDKLPRALR